MFYHLLSLGKAFLPCLQRPPSQVSSSELSPDTCSHASYTEQWQSKIMQYLLSQADLQTHIPWRCHHLVVQARNLWDLLTPSLLGPLRTVVHQLLAPMPPKYFRVLTHCSLFTANAMVPASNSVLSPEPLHRTGFPPQLEPLSAHRILRLSSKNTYDHATPLLREYG